MKRTITAGQRRTLGGLVKQKETHTRCTCRTCRRVRAKEKS